jgi:hypothetical protein
MPNTIGKISGQMLKDDLVRDGVDLAIQDNLLYFNVNSKYIGVNSDTPFRPLTVSGTQKTNILEVPTKFTTLSIDFTNNLIQNTNGSIVLTATGANKVVYAPKLSTDGLLFDNNQISTTRSNENLEFRTTGTGQTKFQSDVEIFGDLHATGSVTLDGNITFGNQSTDTVNFAASINSDLTPNVTDLYDLGSQTQQWDTVYTNLINGAVISVPQILGNIDYTSRQGKIWYVATNGHYDNVGDHQNEPFDTVEKALSVATSGDTIFIYPGTYYELFPLVVPQGVTVKGFDIRSTIIVPDTSSTHEDVFLVDGQSTISDLTIKDFYYDVINDKGYAFRFKPGALVTSRSPYIQNISVITKGSVTSISDPRGFDQGDAGRGAMIDGAVVNSGSISASLLFHSCTFIVPNADCIIMKNGVKVEWLNSFIYFARKGLYAISTPLGIYGNGKTRLKVYGISAQTVIPGNTISVENVSQANTYTTATIESITYSAPHTYITIDGFVPGFEESLGVPDTSNQQRINFSGGQTASFLEFADYSDFGAEVRSIASANVYGTYGAEANGPGTLMYLIGHNFGYIGSGKESNNDPSVASGANEVVEVGLGRIHYQSLDQRGKFKVGSVFEVDGDTGRVTFAPQAFNISGLGNLEFVSGGNRTSIDATQVLTGNLIIAGNTISSTSSQIGLGPQSQVLNITGTLNSTGNLALIGNMSVSNNATLGNGSNTTTINAKVVKDLIPNTTKTYSLGTTSNRWNNIWLNKINLDDIQISSSYITTTQSNSNLDLKSNGTGYVSFETLTYKNNTISTRVTDTDVTISPSGTGKLNFNSNVNLSAVAVFNGGMTAQANATLGTNSSNYIVLSSRAASNLIPNSDNNYNLGSSALQWVSIYNSGIITDDIQLSDNYISTTASNSNLELRRNGTGVVRVDQIDIATNTIQTNSGNANLQIQPNGTGQLVASALTLNSATTFSNNGTMLFNGNVTLSGTITANGRANTNLIPKFTATSDIGSNGLRWQNVYAGNVIVDDILLTDNFISTTASNANLELKGNALGSVILDSVSVKTTTISSTGTNANLNISPSGTGKVLLPDDTFVTGNLGITGNLLVNSNTQLGDALSDIVYFIGSVNTDIVPQTNTAYDLGSSLFKWQNVYAGNVVVDDLLLSDNVISTTASNSNLELRGNGTGSVRIDQLDIKTNSITANTTNTNIQLQASGTGKIKLNDDTNVTGILTTSGNIVVNGNSTLGDASSDLILLNGTLTNSLLPTATATYSIGSNSLRWQGIYAGNIYVDDILITDNYIAITASNSNLELRGNGTGSVRIDQLDIKTNSITANSANTNINISPTGTGAVKLNSNTDVTGNITVSSNLLVNGNTTLGDTGSDVINIVGSLVSKLLPTTTALYDIGSNGLRWQNVYAGNVIVDDLLLSDNVISTSTSNTNLELRGNGTGSVRIDQLDIKTNSITANTANTNVQLQALGTGKIKLNDDTAITGVLTTTGNVVVNGNSTLGNDSSDLILLNGTLTNNLLPTTTATYSIGSNGLRWQNVYAGNVIVDDIVITDNYIATTISNSNLELRGNGTGSVRVDQLDIKDNQLTTNTALTDFSIQATATIRLLSSTDVTGNLTATTSLTVNSNTQFGNATSDSVQFNSYIVSDLIPATTASYDIGEAGLLWNSITAGQILVDSINVNDNYITTTASNANLELYGNGTGAVRIDQLDVKTNIISANAANTDITFTPSGTGNVKLEKSVDITGNFTTTGNVAINGNTTFGDTSADTIDTVSRFTNNLYPSATESYDLGSGLLAWNNLYTGNVNVDSILITDNFISTIALNSNLELRQNGSGSVRIDQLDINNSTILANSTNTNITLSPTGTGKVKLLDDVDITGNLSVNGNVIVGGNVQLGDSGDVVTFFGTITGNLIPTSSFTYDIGSPTQTWRTLHIGQIPVDSIEINDNYITTTVSNANLELRGNGTGVVRVEDLDFTNSTISANTLNSNINFTTLGTGKVVISSTRAAVFPSGNNSNRTLSVGETRFNNSYNTFEGYTASGMQSLYSVFDSDRNTYITPELTPGASDNTLRFVVNGTQEMSLDTQKLQAANVLIDDIQINLNKISTTASNADITLVPNGTGKVKFKTFNVRNNTITNTNNDAVTSIVTTGTGFVNFTSSALQIPFGTNAEKAAAIPETGMHRWNTTGNYLEVYDGTTWQLATGAGGAVVSEADMADLTSLYSIIFG